MTKSFPLILIVPGLRDHVAEHWQTILQEKNPGAYSVPPLEENKFSRAAKVAALDDMINKIAHPVILVAHSAGVMIIAHWVRQASSEQLGKIRGALLATPPDFDTPLPAGYPSKEILEVNGWLPTPTAALPFPSIVVASTNDPLASFEKISMLAHAWRSRLINAGAVGHLNPAAGYGEWAAAEDFIAELDHCNRNHAESRE